MEEIYVVTDLGPGDGGKGGIVHALSQKYDADIIIKRGGAQGSHGVRTSSGESFNFSQWGCGTLEGIPTFLSEEMIISPVGLRNESEALKRLGIYNPFELLTCDPWCIVATPFHQIASQLEELLRGDNPRGTVGTGVGQAYRLSKTLGKEATIRATELSHKKVVRAKLKNQLEFYREKYANITKDSGMPCDAKLIAENLCLLHDDGYIDYCADLFENIGTKLYLKQLGDVIKNNRTAIVECSHGVLTDSVTGLYPHVSAIRTLPRFAEKMLRIAGYDGPIINYAVHRAYEIRHGAGPMPTYDADFTARMLPGSHKEENRWQGIVRAGALDLNLLSYALAASSETKFDGLCLTWFDQILANDRIWPICTSYKNAKENYETYTDFFDRAEPNIIKHSVKLKLSPTSYSLFEYVENILGTYIDVPLETLSTGPTELDKIYSSKI